MQQQVFTGYPAKGELGAQPVSDLPQTVIYVLQCALPLLLAAGLAVEAMFAMVAAVGNRVSGWEDIEDDIDDLLLATVKTKRASRKRKLAADQAPITRPRKWLLLAPLVALLLASCIDVLSLLVLSLISIREELQGDQIWLNILLLGSYLTYGIKYHLVSVDEAATSILLKFVCAVSILFNAALFGCMSAVAFTSRYVNTFQVIQLGNTLFKIAASVSLALAYVPRFREATLSASEAKSSARVCAAENGESPDVAVNGYSTEEDDDDDDDDDDTESKFKKKTFYDWPAFVLRTKRILPLVFPRQSRLAYVLIFVCVALQLLTSTATLLQPRQFGLIVNDLAAGRPPWRNLLIWAVIRGTMNRGGIVQTLWKPVSNRVGRNMDVMTFSHILDLSLTYHSNKKTGEVLSALSRGDAMESVLEQGIFYLIPTAFDLMGSVILLAGQFGVTIVIVVLLTGFAYVSVVGVCRKRQTELRVARTDRFDDKAAIKNESLSNVELLKYFCMEPYEVSRYAKASGRAQKANWDAEIYGYTVDLLKEAIKVSGTLAGALLVANQVIREHSGIGNFVMFLTYINSILYTLDQSHWLSQYFNKLFTDTDKLMDILDEKNEIADRPDAEELLELNGNIEFENVTLVYDRSLSKKGSKGPRKALDGVSFTVNAGEHVALVGETGAGKSTIFKSLYRFYEPQEGCIKVEGRDIREYTQRSLRQAMGIVQQEGAVLNDTIAANIKYGDITASDEKVMKAARMAQLHDRISEWPKGYQTVVGERGVKLSGGEKQRVNIARTILKNPKILLLDEATSALDSNTEKAIQGQLRALTRGRTTIAIAHRLSTIAHADKIIVLDKGRIVETGTHEELLRIEEGFYKKLWETQTASGKPTLDELSSLERRNEGIGDSVGENREHQ